MTRFSNTPYLLRHRFAATLAATAATLYAGQALAFEITGSEGTRLSAEDVATFDEPWAMAFLPDGTLLVTEQRGKLLHVTREGNKTAVDHEIEVAYGGQGGLGDVVADPNFAENRRVWLSYAKSDDGGTTRGAAVVHATLDSRDGKPALTDVTPVWDQQPHVSGKGHFSHRIAFGPDNTPHAGYLFITSGDRQKKTPAQDMSVNLGKIIRLNLDGSVPDDNPYADEGEIAGQFYSIGHRNLLGIDFDTEGNLWNHEMGPEHGDELNRVVAGDNYGWPVVSDGDEYSGKAIPDHDTRDDFHAPAISWVPSIGPAGFVIYDGDRFADWHNDALIGGLVAKAIVRVDLDGDSVREVERYSWNERVREIEQGPDGALWVLEDEQDARLLRLVPEDA